MIESHSDIPFIRRFWAARYRATLPAPRSREAHVLRDADVIDLLWVGGIAKIVHFRQVPGSDFYKEDGGSIQKAIASARRSFEETSSVLSTGTGREIAASRILTVRSFFNALVDVADLKEFTRVFDAFVLARRSVQAASF